jgi:predicted nucleotidyltransferase
MTYPDLRWVKHQLRSNLWSRVEYPVLDAFIIGSEARGTARAGSDIDVAVVIPPVRGKTALQVSERYHGKFTSSSQYPEWEGRAVDFQFFYPDDPELLTYSSKPLASTSKARVRRSGRRSLPRGLGGLQC